MKNDSGGKSQIFNWMTTTTRITLFSLLHSLSLCLLSPGPLRFNLQRSPYQKCMSHATLDSMEPPSSLMAPAHLAVGKFIFHKPTSTQK